MCGYLPLSAFVAILLALGFVTQPHEREGEILDGTEHNFFFFYQNLNYRSVQGEVGSELELELLG